MEPELIDPKKENYSNISKEVFKHALQNILGQIKNSEGQIYLKELIIKKVLGVKELNDYNEAYKELVKIIRSDEETPIGFLEIVLKEVQNKGPLYFNITENFPILSENKNKLPPEILNCILNKLPPTDIINIIKYANDTPALGVDSNIAYN
ncbi:MAG: hypothetical protein ACIPMY_02010 [Rickettsia endosymbiont of Pentastiridius leporinus]